MAVGDVRARRVRRVVGAMALLALVAIATSSGIGAAAPAPPAALVETTGCGRTGIELPPSPPPATVTDNTATVPIVAVIPPTTFVWIDDDGAARRVATNTGCAPRQDDRFLVQCFGDPRAAALAPASMVTAVMAGAFTGDWGEPGRWHDL